MTNKELQDYRKFMNNIENEYNCSQCPENRDFNKSLPCGQQKCWVPCHVRKEK